MVTCDSGILPWYITVMIYIVVLVLVHFFVIKPILRHKQKKYHKFKWMKGKEDFIGVTIFGIVAFLCVCFFNISDKNVFKNVNQSFTKFSLTQVNHIL